MGQGGCSRPRQGGDLVSFGVKATAVRMEAWAEFWHNFLGGIRGLVTDGIRDGPKEGKGGFEKGSDCINI